MLCRDPTVPLNSLLKPTAIYLDTDENVLSLEFLKNVYQLIWNKQQERETKAPTSYIKLQKMTQFCLGIILVYRTLGTLGIVALCLSLERVKLKWEILQVEQKQCIFLM